MSLFGRTALLDTITFCKQAKRFRGKINIQKPKQPHFQKARLLQLTKPIVVGTKAKPIVPMCKKFEKELKDDYVENPLQRFYAIELLQEFESSKMVIFYHMNPMNAEQHYNAFVLFHRQNMLYKNYGKKTLEMALRGTRYETILDFYISHNMLVFSPEVEIKKVLKINKKFPQLVMLAGILEGRLVSKDQLLYYSNIPNLQTAQMELVQTLNAAGSTVVGQLSTHQQTLVSQLSERMKQLEEDAKD